MNNKFTPGISCNKYRESFILGNMYFHRILCNKIISSILVKRLIRSSVDANASQTLDDHKKTKSSPIQPISTFRIFQKSHENHRQSIHLFLFLRVTYSNYYLIHSFYRMASFPNRLSSSYHFYVLEKFRLVQKRTLIYLIAVYF